MSKTYRAICVLAAGLVVTVAGAQSDAVDARALEILRKADAAIKAVDGVAFAARGTPTGVATNFAAPAEGEGVMFGWNGSMPERFFSKVKTVDRQSGEPLELSGGGNGDTFFIIDHRAKQAYEDMDPGVLGSGAAPLRGVGMVEFVHDRPFDDELNAQEVKLLDNATVAGKECYQIHVVYSGGQGKSTWFFATDDYLPRKRIRHFEIPGQGEGTWEITIGRLELNPKVEPERFRLKLPEGFEQIDDFYP